MWSPTSNSNRRRTLCCPTGEINNRQAAVEITRLIERTTACRISRFTMAERLQKDGLQARSSVWRVPLMPAHQRRRVLWCPRYKKCGNKQQVWARVLFTDGSRKSMNEERLYTFQILRKQGTHKPHSNIIEKYYLGGAEFLFGVISCLVDVRTSMSLKYVPYLVPAILPRFFCLTCVFLQVL